LHTDAASSKTETSIRNKPEKKSVDDVEGMGAKNKIWYRTEEPRKVKTERH
jgi:hypothetical protein